MSLTYNLQFYFFCVMLRSFPNNISRFCILWIISFYWRKIYSSMPMIFFFFRFSDFSHWGYLCWNLYNWCLSPEKISQTRRVDPASVQAPHSILLPRLPVSERTQSTPTQWWHWGRVLISFKNFLLLILLGYIQEFHVLINLHLSIFFSCLLVHVFMKCFNVLWIIVFFI